MTPRAPTAPPRSVGTDAGIPPTQGEASSAGGVHPDIAAVLSGERRWCVVQGDCLDVLCGPRWPSAITITDVPYNARKNYGAGTNDSQPWSKWVPWFEARRKAALEVAPDFVTFLSQTAARHITKRGRSPDWTMAWVKPLALAICAMPFMPHWEPIAYWGATRKKDGAFWGSDVLVHNVAPSIHGHPTEKPLPLMLDLVGRFAADVVIDPFCGSASTGAAALRLGRRFVGIEISAEFATIARERLEAESRGLTLRDARHGQLSLLHDTEKP